MAGLPKPQGWSIYHDELKSSHAVGRDASAVLLLSLSAQSGYGQTKQRQAHFNLEGGVLGIWGYDPAAYFTEGKAVKGDKDIAYFYRGATYFFSTKAKAEKFRADPENMSLPTVVGVLMPLLKRLKKCR